MYSKLKQYDDNQVPSDTPDTAKVDLTTAETDAKSNVDSKSANVTSVSDNHEQKTGGNSQCCYRRAFI